MYVCVCFESVAVTVLIPVMKLSFIALSLSTNIFTSYPLWFDIRKPLSRIIYSFSLNMKICGLGNRNCHIIAFHCQQTDFYIIVIFIFS